jgi:hypothetical protein
MKSREGYTLRCEEKSLQAHEKKGVEGDYVGQHGVQVKERKGDKKSRMVALDQRGTLQTVHAGCFRKSGRERTYGRRHCTPRGQQSELQAKSHPSYYQERYVAVK